MNAQHRERDRQTRAADTATGTWYCTAGRHYARGEHTTHRGRKVCPACRDKISRARRRK